MKENLLPKIDETWVWIKFRLELNGLTFGKLARKYGVAKPCFTAVKRKHIPKYERLIAHHVGSEPWLLWPDRYDADHKSKKSRVQRKRHEEFLHDNQNLSKINVKDDLRDCHEADKS